MNDFQIKLNRLPKEVKDFLTSMKATDLNLLIAEKYQIKDEDIRKLLSLISALFFKEISIDNLVFEIQKNFSFDEEKARDMVTDIVGIRLLVVDNWLGGKASLFLKNNNVNISDFNQYVEDQKKALVEEEKYFQEQMREDPEYIPPKPKKEDSAEARKIDYEKEKKDSLEIFKSDLKNILINYDSLYMDDYNSVLVLSLAEDLSFRDALLKSFFDNQEILFDEDMETKGQKSKSTIANWLKDFSENSPSEVNNLSIANYLTNSPNAKNLKEEDKEVLKRLLTIYVNLRNFQKNDPKLPLDQWRILPDNKVEITEEKAEEKKPTLPAPENIPSKPVDSISSKKEVNPKRLPKIQELKEMAEKYPVGSLERKAIETEIKRIQSIN